MLVSSAWDEASDVRPPDCEVCPVASCSESCPFMLSACWMIDSWRLDSRSANFSRAPEALVVVAVVAIVILSV